MAAAPVSLGAEAQLQLRYGHDVRLARLAQEIIVEQLRLTEHCRSTLLIL
jgi:hypothetical protein